VGLVGLVLVVTVYVSGSAARTASSPTGKNDNIIKTTIVTANNGLVKNPHLFFLAIIMISPFTKIVK